MRTPLFPFLLGTVLATAPLSASDHADPIDILGKNPLEPVITDLFVFPVGKEDKVSGLYRREDGLPLNGGYPPERPRLDDAEREAMDALSVILCVRRTLPDGKALNLEPYTYTINFDLTRVVQFTAGAENAVVDGNRARYGGTIANPSDLQPTVGISLRLKAAGENITAAPTYTELKNVGDIRLAAGIFDDPFIFPRFHSNNVVGVVLRIPFSCFPDPAQRDFIVWATSAKGRKPIDHVGRSLRTQNPRFEILNTLPPSGHVDAIVKARDHPDLMTDVFRRLGFQSLFTYRHWDEVPDVMIYSRRYPVGFPNGRYLTDDVVAILAQFGDSLAFELSSYDEESRGAVSDVPYRETFPYLGERHAEVKLPPPPMLTSAGKWKLVGLAVLGLALLLLQNWIFARLYHRWKLRPRYL